MSTYIALINWTEKGVAEAKGSPARLDRARELARSLGGDIARFYMTMGAYDLVAILEMPDDEAAAAFALKSAAGGHIRTTTLKAFDEAAYRKITGAL
jgi:uncharacterized protein with GYD domain